MLKSDCVDGCDNGDYFHYTLHDVHDVHDYLVVITFNGSEGPEDSYDLSFQAVLHNDKGILEEAARGFSKDYKTSQIDYYSFNKELNKYDCYNKEVIV